MPVSAYCICYGTHVLSVFVCTCYVGPYVSATKPATEGLTLSACVPAAKCIHYLLLYQLRNCMPCPLPKGDSTTPNIWPPGSALARAGAQVWRPSPTLCQGPPRSLPRRPLSLAGPAVMRPPVQVGSGCEGQRASVLCTPHPPTPSWTALPVPRPVASTREVTRTFGDAAT